jgi:hypothetical protein
MIFARWMESTGEPRELKQDLMTLVFPPQLPPIAADIMSKCHPNFGKMPKLTTY